jgi:hypothetical protein
MIATQAYLMSLWHSENADALVSTHHPVIYADRLRIRQPGDAGFALGPHVDAGSVERWEDTGYGLGKVYQKIWTGQWEHYDPWEASCRLPIKSDLYQGAGACSMFRMFQGWLSMSETGPFKGTLLVYPNLQLSTAYFLLRPFFSPIKSLEMFTSSKDRSAYLDASNWRFENPFSVELQGANPSHSQELNDTIHPHLELDKAMTHIPEIKAGDYVAWHCDCRCLADCHLNRSKIY